MRKVQALRFVVLFAIAFAASSVRAADTLSVSRAQAEAVGIETAPLEHQPAAIGLRFPARVVVPTNQTRLISAPLAGRIEVIAIKSDEAVRAGQVVAEMQQFRFCSRSSGFPAGVQSGAFAAQDIGARAVADADRRDAETVVGDHQ